MKSLSKSRRARAVAAVAAATVALGTAPAVAGPTPVHVPPECDPTHAGMGIPGCPSVLVGEVGDIENPTIALPDLRPDVNDVYVGYETIDLDPDTGQWMFGRPHLRFDTWAVNEGVVPVDVQTEDPSLSESPVSQCISWTTNLVCRERRPVGGFIWHKEHLHYHFDDFAAYELRRLRPSGEPDWSDEGLIASSPKVSFCLIDSHRIRASASPTPRYITCHPVEEGISPGYADVYGAALEGQSLPLEGLDSGRYALHISLNPEQRMYETKHDNNRITAIVEISGLGGFATSTSIVSKDHSS